MGVHALPAHYVFYEDVRVDTRVVEGAICIDVDGVARYGLTLLAEDGDHVHTRARTESYKKQALRVRTRVCATMTGVGIEGESVPAWGGRGESHSSARVRHYQTRSRLETRRVNGRL